MNGGLGLTVLAGLYWLVAATSVAAADDEFCADRPGLATPPCTLAPGRTAVEIGLADWTLDRQKETRTDTVVAGDTLLRFGLSPILEAQLGWTAYGHVRTRDRVAAGVTRMSGIGDVRMSVRRSLSGSGGPVAIQPFVTLPTGGSAIGAGDWDAGVLLPVQFDLTPSVQLGLTPEIDSAVDADGSGRHLAFSGVAGLSGSIAPKLDLTGEVAAMRDDDPAGSTTSLLASLSVACHPTANSQFDVGLVAGLDRTAPDIELYVGGARRF